MEPFVKWAGGKRQLLNELLEFLPDEYNTYYEPFIGGGALFLTVAPKRYVINDTNSELVCAYRSFTNKDSFDELVRLLHEHEAAHSEEHYYSVRAMDRDPDFLSLSPVTRAARMIYLNKSCFNGLFRVNAKGYNNVPSAKKASVNCVNEENYSDLFEYFANTEGTILNGDFEAAVESAQKGDFIYFDPPYDVLENKNSFTSYAKNPFGKEEQIRLAEVFSKMSDRGVKVMLSNHNTPFIQELYAKFHIHVVLAKRLINSNANGRGAVEEVIITNY